MSTSAAVLVGDEAQVSFSFTALGTSTLTDPTIVKVIHRSPTLIETEYVFGVDPEIQNPGVGQYTFNIVVGNEPLTHWFRTWGSGDVDKAEEIGIEVTESYFLNPLP